MKILALDIATQTGWCNDKGYGTWKMNATKGETNDFRICKFADHLEMMFINNKPDFVAYELPAGRFMKPIMTESELIGVLKLMCMENNIDYQGFTTTEIKRHCTGRGNAKKQEMMDAVIAKYNMLPKNYDEADAIAMYHLALEKVIKNV